MFLEESSRTDLDISSFWKSVKHIRLELHSAVSKGSQVGYCVPGRGEHRKTNSKRMEGAESQSTALFLNDRRILGEVPLALETSKILKIST